MPSPAMAPGPQSYIRGFPTRGALWSQPSSEMMMRPDRSMSEGPVQCIAPLIPTARSRVTNRQPNIWQAGERGMNRKRIAILLGFTPLFRILTDTRPQYQLGGRKKWGMMGRRRRRALRICPCPPPQTCPLLNPPRDSDYPHRIPPRLNLSTSWLPQTTSLA